MPRFGLFEQEEENDYYRVESKRSNNAGFGGFVSNNFNNSNNNNSFFASPSPNTTTIMTSTLGSSPNSLRLACGSNNETTTGSGWYYSLHGKPGNYAILTQSLLHNNNNSNKKSFTTRLPDFVQAYFKVDAPVELFCWGDTATKASTTEEEGEGLPPPSPLLCLYATKTLLTIQIKSYQNNNNNYNNEDEDEVCQCTCLLENFLLDGQTRIVRVRAAPSRNTGHAYYAPMHSCAVLLTNADGTEYQLVTLNATKGTYRIPLVIPMQQPEESAEGSPQQQRLVDFDFAKSQGPLAFLSSLTCLFLAANGDVSAATPILWDNAIVPKSTLEQSLQALSRILTTLDRSNPRRRQVLAAQRYLIDIFQGTHSNSSTTKNQFAQAVFTSTEASVWPVAYQANILHYPTQVNYAQPPTSSTHTPTKPRYTTKASSLATLAAGDWMGLVVGRAMGWIEWAILSPAMILPLFTFCPLRERMHIGHLACQQTQWVERVYLQMPTNNNNNNNKLLLVMPDVVAETLFHVLVPNGVYTVSTNALFVAAKQLRSHVDAYMEVPAKRTTAWATLQASSDIWGAVVWATPAHGLSVRLADGTTVVLPVTKQQYRHELLALFAPRQKASSSSLSSGADSSVELQQTPPFYDSIEPLLQKITQGLSKMSKVVGSSTRYQDMTPELMASVIALKEQVEKEVSLPVMELAQLTKARKKGLATMIAVQQDKLNDLLQQKEDLELGRETMLQRLEQAERNMATLAERSARMRDALITTAPTMTRAEKDFCEHMELSKAKVDHWEGKVIKKLLDKAAKERELWQSYQPNYSDLTADHVQKISVLGKFSDTLLQKTRARLHQVDKKLQALAEKAGMDEAALRNVVQA